MENNFTQLYLKFSDAQNVDGEAYQDERVKYLGKSGLFVTTQSEAVPDKQRAIFYVFDENHNIARIATSSGEMKENEEFVFFRTAHSIYGFSKDYSLNEEEEEELFKYHNELIARKKDISEDAVKEQKEEPPKVQSEPKKNKEEKKKEKKNKRNKKKEKEINKEKEEKTSNEKIEVDTEEMSFEEEKEEKTEKKDGNEKNNAINEEVEEVKEEAQEPEVTEDSSSEGDGFEDLMNAWEDEEDY